MRKDMCHGVFVPISTRKKKSEKGERHEPFLPCCSRRMLPFLAES